MLDLKRQVKSSLFYNCYAFLRMKYSYFKRKKILHRVTEGSTKINILKTFPLFEAHGWGWYPIRAKLTIQSINQLIPALNNFSSSNSEHKKFASEVYSLFINKSDSKDILAKKFNFYGSDKASTHDYNKLYGGLLEQFDKVDKIFEIGLGTNHTDIVSTMGKNGRPGASLRAFRDCYQNAQIYGADFDRRVLFEEHHIKTFFVDQTNLNTFEDLGREIGADFDLMIDDGLHSPNANLHSLYFFLSRLKIGGFAVIEDINPQTMELWNIVTSMLPENFMGTFFQTKSACVYVVRKLYNSN